jgi:hypothetical protein
MELVKLRMKLSTQSMMNLARRLSKSLVFWAALFTLLTLGISGLSFMYGNYADVPIIKEFMNPELFPNDILINNIDLNTPQFYFQRGMAELIQFFHLENHLDALFFGLYCLATFLTFLALARIVNYLFKDIKTTVIFLFLVVLGIRLIFLGAPILFQNQFNAKVLAYPFLFFAFDCFFRKRYLVALILVGIAFNIHTAFAAYTLALFAFYHVLNLKSIKISTLVISWGAMLILALPTLIPTVLNLSGASDPFAVEMHRFFTYGHVSPVIMLTQNPLNGVISLFGIALWFYAWKLFPPEGEKQRVIWAFWGALGIMYLVGFLFVDVIKVGFFARLFLPYSTWFFTLFGLMQVAHLLNRGAAERRLGYAALIIIAVSLLMPYILPISVALIWLSQNSYRFWQKEGWINFCRQQLPLLGLVVYLVYLVVRPPENGGIVAPLLLGLAIIMLVLITHPWFVSKALVNFWVRNKSKFYYLLIALVVGVLVSLHGVTGPFPDDEVDQAWKDVQLWTNSTPIDTVFVTPPYYYNFNRYSERDQLVNYIYAGNAIFSPEIIPSYLERMEDETGVDIKKAVENHDFEFDDKIKANWEDLSLERLEFLADKYHASYVIRENDLPLDLEIVYSNVHFSVYAIK